MAKVKICGVRDPETAAFAMRCGADWIGLVLVEASPRYVTPDQVRAVRNSVPGANTVALVVNPSDEDVDRVMSLGIQTLQLHGQESPERVIEVRQRFDGEVWKALGVATRGDLARAESYVVDRLLIDAKPPKGASRTGGHGQAFDWGILDGWAAPKPWLLAGGLTPENVGQAIAVTGAGAVDVSSGVERETGVKDTDLIAAFITASKTDT